MSDDPIPEEGDETYRAGAEPTAGGDLAGGDTVDHDGVAGDGIVGDGGAGDGVAGDGGAADDAALAQAAQAVEEDLLSLVAERDEFLDAYRRTQADFENFRKQAQRRQTDEVNRSLGAFVERLLPVLDACDAAIAHGADGAREVFNALLGALEKEGLQRVDPLGEPFDPNVAEAVMHEPGDGGEQLVAEVLRVGYLWNERVLRPAMVKVKD